MQTINEDIKNGTFKPVYLLYGEEAFLKQSYKKKLRAAISGDDGAASMKREDRLADFRISIMHPVRIFCENGWMYVPKGVSKNISIE